LGRHVVGGGVVVWACEELSNVTCVVGCGLGFILDKNCRDFLISSEFCWFFQFNFQKHRNFFRFHWSLNQFD
jgi:hypothetical protein